MIHLIGNAHLDPAWMWPLEEGLEAFAATCRSALDRLSEYPDLIFTCSSAAHYEYVEKTDPLLFSRIVTAVRGGRWCIVGGWWVEADCNLPSGEALIRQALLGQSYFESRFGRIATVGYNIDSFGHNANLPTLLAGAGLMSYVFMRPEEEEAELPDALFQWQSASGASVIAYRLPLHYSNHQLSVKEKVVALPSYPHYVPHRDWMLFFGVGNHGGGPTIEQLNSIRDLQGSEGDLILSDPERFFQAVIPDVTVKRELNPHAIGAYAANAEIKRLNRRAEHALLRAERMRVLRGAVVTDFGDLQLQQAWKDLCLTQFHDLIGGVSIEEASDETIDLQRSALKLADESARLDRQRIASRIHTSNIENLVIFNDSIRPRKEYIEFEVWHQHASENGELLKAVSLEDPSGNRVPCQKIESSGKIGEDRVRWLAQISAAAFGWSTYSIHRHEETRTQPFTSRHVPEDIRLLVSEDSGDTWAHGLSSYLPAHTRFEVRSTRQIEAGPLRSGIRQSLEYGRSRAELEFFEYVNDETIELHVMLDWHESNQNVLLAISHGLKDPRVRYEIPYAWIERPADGKEYPGQCWLDAFDPATGKGLAVANDSKYSFSVDEHNIYVTLARSKPYAYHVPPHNLSEGERIRYLDHGRQTCRFLLRRHNVDISRALVESLSDRLNDPLAVHHESRHEGELPVEASLLSSDNPAMKLGAVKVAEDGEGFVIRLVEQEGRSQSATLSGRLIPTSLQVECAAFEIKSFRVADGRVSAVDFLERAL